MSVKTTTVYVRPNVNINFFMNTSEQQQHRKENYIDTNKMVLNISDSEDQLTRTVVNDFAQSQHYAEYISDSIILQEINQRQLYNLQNNINTSITVETV